MQSPYPNERQLKPATSLEWLALFLAVIMALLLTTPLLALLIQAVRILGLRAADVPVTVLQALALSLSTTSVSILVILMLGTPLAFILARYHFWGKQLLTVVIETPIVMPPVVAGLALLTVFGRRGWFGPVLEDVGIVIPFTTAAVILAQVFVAAPFYIRLAELRFTALAPEIREAAMIDGTTTWQLFWYIYIPLSSRAMISGLMLSWARALGEFGATILFAGNLPGRTQTMPLLVYSALERDFDAAYITGALLLLVAVLAFATTRWLARIDEAQQDVGIS